jgi:hypothetical protein
LFPLHAQVAAAAGVSEPVEAEAATAGMDAPLNEAVVLGEEEEV